jgi:hypothetical protein
MTTIAQIISFDEIGASGKVVAAKRNHTCSVCFKSFKRSEHCIRHQRARKAARDLSATALCAASYVFCLLATGELLLTGPRHQTPEKNRSVASIVAAVTHDGGFEHAPNPPVFPKC